MYLSWLKITSSNSSCCKSTWVEMRLLLRSIIIPTDPTFASILIMLSLLNQKSIFNLALYMYKLCMKQNSQRCEKMCLESLVLSTCSLERFLTIFQRLLAPFYYIRMSRKDIPISYPTHLKQPARVIGTQDYFLHSVCFIRNKDKKHQFFSGKNKKQNQVLEKILRNMFTI